jgi:homoserine kinase
MRVTVRVPATSANLGPGFDCFGLALDLCNEVTVDTDGEPGVTWDGEGADELPTDGSDLISRTMGVVANRIGLPLPPVRLSATNRIPLERGLGSSSAAAVAGVVLASVVLDVGIHTDPFSTFSLAAEIEGHPDNAAPAVYGGFTIASPDGIVRRLEPHPDLRPVAIVPAERLATSAARALLGPTVAREDAVYNIAHAALVVEGLTRDPSLLEGALRDRIHQDARLTMLFERVASLDDVIGVLDRAHLPWCVSGAGPTLLVFDRDPGTELSIGSLGVWSAWGTIIRPGVRVTGFELVSS